jgi:hypothetical protein
MGRITGKGSVDGEIYAAPVPDPELGLLIGEFAGDFTWRKVNDPCSSIYGTFFGYDILIEELIDPKLPIEEQVPIFDTVIYVNIEGGTGKFAGWKGTAVAKGIDDPLGLEGVAGTTARLKGRITIDRKK